MNNNISVIISSHLSDEENTKFFEHVKKTSGLKDIEILIYPNLNEYSLAEIYNKGLQDASNDITLFIHNDITFETKNWGRKLLKHFEKSEYGILGVAGTTDLHKDGKWWTRQNRMIGSLNHINNNKKVNTKYSNKFGNEIIGAAVVDGVFIAVDCKKIKKGFDEDFKGFHFYDLPFCVSNYRENVKIGVIFDIEITHNSVGNLNYEWFSTRNKFLYKYDKYLPINHPISLKNNNYSPKKIKNRPNTSIIIPNKENNEILMKCIYSICEYDTENIEIIVADTGSSPESLELLKMEFRDKEFIRIVEYNYYNFAKINNDVVKNHVSSDTELLIFCNNDIELINDAINIIIETYTKNRHNIGTIGCRLHYPDNSVQHSSVICINKDDQYIITHYALKSNYTYYSDNIKNKFGNTAALMGTPYKTFQKIGGFNENYIECFEDVEYNMECIINGKTNYFCGEAVAYHYESLTRDLDTTKKEKMAVDYERVISFLKGNINKLNPYILK